MVIRNALIVGATGLVGKELTARLVKSNYYNSLHIVGRHSYFLEHPKIHSYTIDFDQFETFKTDALIHDVYICLGTTMKKAGSKENFRKVDHDYVFTIAQWAKNNRIEKLAFISSMGANPYSSNFYLRTKGEIENALIGLEFPRLILFRPSLLLGKREEFRFAENMGKWLANILNPVLKWLAKNYQPVKASQVADAMFRLTLNASNAVQIIENKDIITLSV
jgi:uncharacterized protein YbjT (DUF2867 family)